MKISTDNPSPIQFIVDSGLQVRNSLARVFSTLTAIQKDGNATIQLLKVARYAIFVLRAYYGKVPGTSIARRDLETTIDLLEGLQFIGVISSLLPVKKDDDKTDRQNKTPLLERITDVGFKVSDCFSGALWLLSKGIPLLGAFSKSKKIISSFEIASLGAALIASITDGGSAAKIIAKHWKVSIPDKTSAIWNICERITGAASIVLILAGVGGTLASVATGLAAASAFCGLVRFAYDLDLSEEAKQT